MATPKDLIVITIDCMRADFMGEQITPTVYGFGTRGTVYTSAYANGCGTSDSFTALLASRLSYPFAHLPGVDADKEWLLKPTDLTLAEVLKTQGYETAAFVGGNPYLGRKYGYHRGFETYEDNQPESLVDRITGGRLRGALREMAHHVPWSPYPRAGKITQEAIDWLSARRYSGGGRPPIFLWLHYMDAHFPTLPPGHHGLRERRAAWSPVEGKGAKHHDLLVRLYKESLTYVDGQVAKLLSVVPANCTAVITADHGQLFGEHGSYWHNGVWEQLLRVPLVIVGPTVARKVVQEPVQLLDLCPHLAKLLGIRPPGIWAGAELCMPDEPIYAVSNSKSARTYAEALVSDTRKVIKTPDKVWEYERAAEPVDMLLNHGRDS